MILSSSSDRTVVMISVYASDPTKIIFEETYFSLIPYVNSSISSSIPMMKPSWATDRKCYCVKVAFYLSDPGYVGYLSAIFIII